MANRADNGEAREADRHEQSGMALKEQSEESTSLLSQEGKEPPRPAQADSERSEVQRSGAGDTSERHGVGGVWIWGGVSLLLVAVAVFLVTITPGGSGNVVVDFLVPTAAGTFSFAVNLFYRNRQELRERKNQRQLDKLTDEREERENEFTRRMALQAEVFQTTLQRRDQDFRLALAALQAELRTELEQGRDRMATQLSIAGLIGEINGHLSTIQQMLALVPPEREPDVDGPHTEITEVAAQATIRIPEGLRHVIRVEGAAPLEG